MSNNNTKKSVAWSQHLRYQFDDFMSRGSSSSFVALTVVFLGLFVFVAISRALYVVSLDGLGVERGDTFWRQVWIAFLEMTDPGSMTQDIDSAPAVKVFAIIAGLLGLILLSALIAVITTALDQRLALLRKGHSQVVLDEHTLIVGWNERIVDLLDELILANESEASEAVVILADRDKEEMDDYLALQVPERLTTKIVTRSGDVSSLVNLQVASVESCRSVVILSSAPPGPTQEDLDRSDMKVIKTILGVHGALDGRDVPIVAEIFNEERRQTAIAIDPEHVVAIDAEDMLAKILVQTSRNEGLAVVYEEILSFDGAEIYLHEPETSIEGATVEEATFRLPDGVMLGISRSDGTIELNPSADTPLAVDDELIILASDDSAIEVRSEPLAAGRQLQPSSLSTQPGWERELIIGWTAKLPTIIREYGDYITDGSAIDIVLRDRDADRSDELAVLSAEVGNLQLQLLDGNPSQASDLLELRPFDYDNIIVLSEAGKAGAAEWADSETLLYLLQLQQIFRDNNSGTTTKLVAEVLDSRNRELVTQTGVREFVISNRLVSMVMAQISEEKQMALIYDDLFSEAGSEVYLKPINYYFDTIPDEFTFADVMVAAFQREETALGVRQVASATNPSQNFGVTLIPEKMTTYRRADLTSIVVLAEDEA